MATAPTSAGSMLELIRSGRASTRRELQALTGLSRSTVAQRLDLLLGAGWLRESGVDSSSGGRPPTRLEFSEDHAVVLAASLDTTRARAAVLDLAGRPLAEHTGDLAVADGPEPVLDALAGRFGRLLERAGRDPGEVCGIGVAVPGPVEFGTGRVIRPPIMPGWDGYPVPEHLRKSFDVPVLVDNDANMMALGEQVAGYRDCPAFVLVKVSTGIGAGVVTAGSVYRGIDGGAGDIGHIRLHDRADALCQCGSYGCLAAVASGGALAKALTGLGVPTDSGSGVREHLMAGLPEAVRLAREAGQRVGEVLTTVVCLLNPGVLMVSGDLAETHFVTGVREVLYQRALPRATRNLQVVTGRLGERAGLQGVGHLVVEHLYAPAQADARLAEGAAS
ncbi:putative NBD/HSP70 family sugar kinase [Spinactinospora alkalitolerans]|uniref:Putative NBD/HSP70 family sugar kinase n=1 Tax=Spinactinospora alkalitolerans TaxID=687207 RepID=A0A852U2E9_9ACTN|nr:ROK family protein [Spinactinospora alkalitolerans]NYE50301.1 putative NBD/HSP70 family sugar kinase [Spinactinospora alkalitolerans]